MEKLTAQQILEKFPETKTVNEAWLVDIICPRCGGRETFEIKGTVLIEITDGDIDSCSGDSPEWNLNSSCRCANCDLTGSVKDFHFLGLDSLIKNQSH